MTYPTHLIPTTVVGSYPQPDWLVDRSALEHHGVPRVHAHDIWRIPEEWREAAQDDATILAIGELERAGIDIVSDGEIRRESYSNYFGLSLDGLDTENVGSVIGANRRATPVPRVVGRIRRKAAVELRDAEFLVKHAARATKITLPGPFTLAQQCENTFYKDEEEMAMDFAAAVNEELAALKATGVDVVQLDEPWVPRRPGQGRALRRQGDRPGARRHLRPDRRPHLPRLRPPRAQQARRLRLPAPTRRLRRRPGVAGSGQPQIDLGVLKDLSNKTILLGVLDLGTTVETAATVARPPPRRPPPHRRRPPRGGTGLRDEIPAAGRGVREIAGDGRRGGDRAAGARVIRIIYRLYKRHSNVKRDQLLVSDPILSPQKTSLAGSIYHRHSAKAGTQGTRTRGAELNGHLSLGPWVPAFAGMTVKGIMFTENRARFASRLWPAADRVRPAFPVFHRAAARAYAPASRKEPRMKRLVATFALLGCLAAAPLARAAETVDLLLVLAADVSRSIDDGEFDLQRKGYAAAMADPRVVGAIVGGKHHAIAVTFIEWAGDQEEKTVIDWTVIRDEEGAGTVGAAILAAPRSFIGRTSISAAIDFAMERLAAAPVPAEKRIIDISGDGTSNSGRGVTEARDDALAKGVTINGLAIINSAANPGFAYHTHPPGGLPNYFQENVVGGNGAFLLVVENFRHLRRRDRPQIDRRDRGRRAARR